MNPLKILVVEDNTITALHLCQTLEEAGHNVTAVARNLEQAMIAVTRNPPDLALIDIELEGSTADGIATAKELLTHHRMPIIYLTANSEPKTIQSAKDTLPAAYLLKPFRPEELILNIELAYNYFQSVSASSLASPATGLLYLPVNGGHEKIDTNDVLYVKADGSYALVFLADERKYDKQKYHISMNLSNLAQYFPTANFYRLSRSFLVNLNYVKRLKDDCLHLDDNQTVLQIPVTNRKELLKKLTIVRTK